MLKALKEKTATDLQMHVSPMVGYCVVSTVANVVNNLTNQES